MRSESSWFRALSSRVRCSGQSLTVTSTVTHEIPSPSGLTSIQCSLWLLPEQSSHLASAGRAAAPADLAR